jgi:hypothetical protein
MLIVIVVLAALLVVAAGFILYDRRKKPVESRYYAKVRLEHGTLDLVLNEEQFGTFKAWLGRMDIVDGLFEIESAGAYVAIFRRQVTAVEAMKR